LNKSIKLVVFGFFILNLGLAFIFLTIWISTAYNNLFWKADFTALYTGWSLVANGKGPLLYDFNLQSEHQGRLLNGESFADGLLPFNYPPHTAIILIPLGYLNLKTSFFVWSFIQLVTLIGVLLEFKKYAKNWTFYEYLLLVSGVLAFLPLFGAFMMGGLSLFVLLGIFLYFRCQQQNKHILSSIFLILSSIKPQAMILLPILLLEKRWMKTLSALAVGFGLIYLITGLILGWNIWSVYFQLAMWMNTITDKYGINPELMNTIKGLLISLFNLDKVQIIVWVNNILLAITSIWIFWKVRPYYLPGSKTFALGFALVLSIGLILSPHLYLSDDLLLLIPFVIYYDYQRENNKNYKLLGVAALCVPLIFLLSSYTDLHVIKIPLFLKMALSVLIYHSFSFETSRFGDRNNKLQIIST
jgi:hypothetical protein